MQGLPACLAPLTQLVHVHILYPCHMYVILQAYNTHSLILRCDEGRARSGDTGKIDTLSVVTIEKNISAREMEVRVQIKEHHITIRCN